MFFPILKQQEIQTMCLKKLAAFNLVGLLLAATMSAALAAVPETVPVGNPENKSDATGYGAVGYAYKIGKYEVTNAEYCEFLNAVAKNDTRDLYDGRMAEQYGGIDRSGSAGKYAYTVKSGMAKKPVGYVTWESCARYTNWLNNGPSSTETETGGYDFKSGSLKLPNHAELAKASTVKWALPTENEWYKAAYFDPSKSGGAGYWQYPGKGYTAPAANLSSDTPSEAGSFTKAVTAFGTFDQGGNQWEYNEASFDGKVGLRGGSWYLNDNEGYMDAATRYDVLSAKWPNYGFRVVALGEAAK